MASVADVVDVLKTIAPPELAEEWDNVGLLVGDDRIEVNAVMTCLTLTPDVAREAVQRGAGLVVSHHPILFRPVQRLTGDTAEGRMLLDLISAGVTVFSPHTSYDSAGEGINQQLAERLELNDINVLRPQTSADADDQQPMGAGRFGDLPAETTLGEFNRLVKQRLGIDHLQYVGEDAATIGRVGIACGSAAEFMTDAMRHNCHALLTGEARFHACLEARASSIALILVGHYASERPAMEHLANLLAERFPKLTVWASDTESDPVRWG